MNDSNENIERQADRSHINPRRRPFFWLGVLVLILLAGPVLIPFNTSSSTTFTLNFRPTEDTYIKDSRADKNYGQHTTLEADSVPSTKRFLMRFRVGGVPAGATVTGATLKLFTVDPSEESGEVHAVQGGWNEASTTWTNAPIPGSKIADVSSPAFAGNWTSSDVESVVVGNGDINLFVTTVSGNGVDYVSSEGGINGPILSVQWTLPSGSPSPSATPSPQPTPVLTPTPGATPPPTSGATPTPVVTPTPGTTPGSSSFQPAPPIQATFFYPWFPNAWNQGGVTPFSVYQPTYGYYSSVDNAIIDQQLVLADRAHQEAMISSWWGQGHHTDTSFKHILGRSERVGSPVPNMRWSLYYEPEGYGDPSVSQIVNDLNYMAANFFNHPGYLRVGGKPVIFIWATSSDSCAMADRWAQAKAQFGGNIHVVLKVFSGYLSCASQPDSWHQYGPANPISTHLPNSVNVSPGFWHVLEGSARLARDPARFEADVKTMAASNAFWKLTTSWNEWGEGTGIEPTTQFGNIYIDILCRNLPGATPCTGGGSTATPTPAPVLTPVPTAVPTLPPPPSGGSQVLVGAGDIAKCGIAGAEETARLLDGIAGTVFTAGDNAYEEGTLQQYNDCYEPTWGRHKARTKPVPGNHEYLTSGASGYCAYFGAAAACPNAYYAYDIGNWRVYALNSSNVNKSVELAWLQADLAANPRACTVAYWHHPTLTAGPHANDEGSMMAIWRAFYDAGGDLVVTGHDHNYQRYAPLNRDSNAATAGGMRQIVIGVGGKNITTQSNASSTPGLEVAMDGDTNPAFGVLKLTLGSASYNWQFVPVAGKTFTDSGSQSCR